MKQDTLSALIHELEVVAAKIHGKLCIVVQVVQSLKGSLAEGKDNANIAESWAYQTWHKMSELRALFEVLDRILCGNHAHVA